MFENMIIQTDLMGVKNIIQEMGMKPSIYLVEIDGANIQSWRDFISEIEEKMKFPTTCIDSIDRYLDWIRDLSWLNSDGYVLIIYNYSQFLLNDLRIKELIMDSFKDTVLPWWQGEVEKFVVDGKAKPFNVYLVN